ncbi:hypothetical protein [Virgibacillus dokdonensis]|uniref:hypothetical protein n=1 Tax=Virgibacillus dokdonensis TaxID=302167 RepID=UPI0011C08428
MFNHPIYLVSTVFGICLNIDVDIISPLVTGITIIIGNYMSRFKEKDYMNTSQPEMLQKENQQRGNPQNIY